MRTRTLVLLASITVSPLALVAQGSVDRAADARLTPPADGRQLRVAFVMSDGAVMIDFAGPWEVFQDVMIPSRGATMEAQHPFALYTVSESTKPIRASDGMQIVPAYTFDNAPAPDIVIIPAQNGRSRTMLDWIRRAVQANSLVVSICTGAFVLADAGLLTGKQATTHHAAYDMLRQRASGVMVVRGMRYVQSDSMLYTSAGLSSGIDLALHLVELYFGRSVAQATAATMEYEGAGWRQAGRAPSDSVGNRNQ